MIEASSSYPLANALWTMFVFFAWVIWIWMLITIYSDLFRRHDVSGWAKGAWTVFLLVVPFIGDELGTWIRGDYTISDVTLNRFYAFHIVAVPLVLIILAAVHLMALHEVGSNNPDGIEIKQQPKDPKTGIYLDGIYSHPYYTIKDLVGVVFFLIIFSIVVFFMPDVGGYFLESNNFIPADPLKTPEHIAPVWYFTPYYAILRAVPSFLGSQFWACWRWSHRSSSSYSCPGSTEARSSRFAIEARSTRAGSGFSSCASWCWATSAPCPSRSGVSLPAAGRTHSIPKTGRRGSPGC